MQFPADQIDIFKGLSSEDQEQIFEKLNWKQYKKGAQIITQRDNTDSVYFLGEGTVRAIIYSINGREISYEDLPQGSMFGELSAIDQEPRSTHVVCLTDCSIAHVSRQEFWNLFHNYPQIAEAVVRRLSGMVRFLCNRVYEYGALDVKDRVRSELLRLARNSGVIDNQAEIRDMPTHQEIANRVRTHREAVTREIGELDRLDVIKSDRRHVIVKNVSALEQLILASS